MVYEILPASLRNYMPPPPWPYTLYLRLILELTASCLRVKLAS